MIKQLTLLSILALFCCGAFGQTPSNVKVSSEINDLVNKHIAYNKARNGINGYRIQIFFDSGNNSKTRAYAIKSNFVLKYAYVNSYITYEAPNYKVRVGDFRTRLDAEKFRNEIIEEYPAAFCITDIINLPKLDIYDEL